MLSLSLAPHRSAIYGAVCAGLFCSIASGVSAAQPPPNGGGQPGASQSTAGLPPEIQKLSNVIARANKLYAARQYREALAAYQEFVRLAIIAKLNTSAILSAYSDIALIDHTLGDNKGYAETLVKIVALDPKNSRALVQLALTSSLMHNYADAEMYANKTIELKPEKNVASTAHFVKGNVAVFHKDFVTAANEFEEAAKLLPSNAMAHFNGGLALAEQKRYDDALKELEAAHKLDPKDARINQYLGTLKTYMASLKAPSRQAAPPTQFDAALKKDPHNVPALLGKARQLVKLGRTKDAIAAYIAVILVVPDSYDAHFNVARLYLTEQDYDHAKEHYRVAQQIAEKAGNSIANANALGGLANAELQQGLNLQDSRGRTQAFTAAEADIQRAMTIQPKQDDYRSVLCRIYEAEAKFKNAATVYRAMLVNSPDNLSLYARLANTYKAVRDVPGFVSVWKEYQARRPDDPNSYEFITEMYNQVGNYQGAADTLRELLKRKLTNSVVATASVILGQDLIELKQIDAGRAEFKKVLDMTPSKVDAQYILGEKAALDAAQRGAIKALARQASNENKYDDAIGYMEDLKKREAELYRTAHQSPDGEVYKNIAALYEESKRPEKAMDEYAEMSRALPLDKTPHEEMGRLLENAKKIDAAAAEYRRAAKLNKKDSTEDSIKISEMYQRYDMLDKAVTELEALRNANPRKIEVLTLLAQIYRRTHQDTKALKIYDDIIKTNPTQGWVQDARAQLLTNLGQYKDAENVYVEEITRNPKAGRQTYADLARDYALEGRADAFLDFMKPRFEGLPSNSTAMAVVYDEFNRQKKETQGQAYISGVIEKLAGTVRRNALESYATLLQLNKHNAESLDVYRKIAKENPKDLSAWVGLADQLDFNGMHDDANRIYVDQIARTGLQPDDRFGLQYKLASRYYQQNKLNDARAAFQELFNAHKVNYEVAMRLGDVIEKTSASPDEPLAFYNSLLGIPTYTPRVRVDIRDRLGILYEKAEKKDDAVTQFKEAIKLSPDDAIANAQLKKLQPNSVITPAQ